MKPTRPILSDAMRILDGLENPAGAECDGSTAHLRELTPAEELVLVSIMGPNGLSYFSNAVGTFGAVSTGGGLGSSCERGSPLGSCACRD